MCFGEIISAASVRLMLTNSRASSFSRMANAKADIQKKEKYYATTNPPPESKKEERVSRRSSCSAMMSSHQAEAEPFQVHPSLLKERKRDNKSARAHAAAEGTATSS